MTQDASEPAFTNPVGTPHPDALKHAVTARADSVGERLSHWLSAGTSADVTALWRDAHGLAGAAAALGMQPLAAVAWRIAGMLDAGTDAPGEAPELTDSLRALLDSLDGAARAAGDLPLVLPVPTLWLSLTDSAHAATVSAAADSLGRPLQAIEDPASLLEGVDAADAGLLLSDTIPECSAALKSAGWRTVVIGGGSSHEEHLAAIKAGIDRYVAAPVNAGFEEITGYAAHEVLGRNCRFLQGDDTRQPALAELRNALREGRQVSVVLSNYRKDGSLFWNDLTLSPIFDHAGQLTHYVGVQRDVTQRVKDEMALYKTVENLRTIQERLQLGQTHAHVGTMDWDIAAGRMYWSDSVPPLFGYQAGEVQTDFEHFIAALHPDDCDAVLKALDACVQHDLHYDMEYRVVWPDGSVRWQSGSGAAIRDAHGQAIRLIAILQDIDGRKRTEIALIAAREQADRANRAKSEFLSHMSHELRTPMNAVLGFAQIMQYDDMLPESHVENVNEIMQAGNHLVELINEVLDLARIESGSVDLSIEPVALPAVIDECLSLIQPMATQRGVEIRRPPAPAFAVRGDRTRLKQALLNLLSNAVKYNSSDGVLSLTVSPSGNDNRVQIGVSDTGDGLSPGDIERVFEPFERLGRNHSGIEGTGIGLTITRRMIDMMGGSVTVQSTPGKGSTFWIELPWEDFPADASLAAGPETGDMDGATRGAAGDERSVLYIEDNPSNIRLMAQIMAQRQHVRLRTAHTAEHGIELALSRPPDLILMDINLPGLDGYETLQVLRRASALQQVPVIALSASALPRDIQRGREAGFADYLTKPLQVSGFLKVLDRCLNITDTPPPTDGEDR